jgi:hypothetical protein
MAQRQQKIAQRQQKSPKDNIKSPKDNIKSPKKYVLLNSMHKNGLTVFSVCFLGLDVLKSFGQK